MFAKVRESCRKVSEREGSSVRVSRDGVDSFCRDVLSDRGVLEILSKAERDEIQQPVVFRSGSEPTTVPVDFNGSTASEANFTAVLALMQLGSGFRLPLHRIIGIGASDTMTLGTVELHNACSKNLDADALARLSQETVSKCFNLENPDEEIQRLSRMIHRVLVEAGSSLKSKGHRGFFELAMAHKTAESLVGGLVDAIPGFRDCAEGGTVWLCKKAQLCASDLAARFSKRGLFDFPDISASPVFVDNVLPAVLRAFGVIVLSPALVAKIDSGQLLHCGEAHEVELRACALMACEEIVAKSAVICPGVVSSARALDWLLWVVGKRPDLRKVQRHLCQDTPYY